MYGVSPAYLVSSFGTSFSPEDIALVLPQLHNDDFSAYQPEIYLRSDLKLWSPRAIKHLESAQKTAEITASVFIAHFAHDEFSSLDALKKAEPSYDALLSMDAAALLGAKDWGVPLLPFIEGFGMGIEGVVRAKEKFHRFTDACSKRNLGFALELAKDNAFGGLEDFITLRSESGFETIRIVFDTGHAFVCGSDLPAMAKNLSGSIAATHICDSGKAKKNSLAPGCGQVPLAATLKALLEAGWKGSLDLEISCAPHEARQTYRSALASLKRLTVQV